MTEYAQYALSVNSSIPHPCITLVSNPEEVTIYTLSMVERISFIYVQEEH